MNPTEDMKKKNEKYVKNGCKFSPISKKGNTYSYTADCKTQGVARQSKITITVENDSAYSLKIVTQSGKQARRNWYRRKEQVTVRTETAKFGWVLEQMRICCGSTWIVKRLESENGE
jgi:vacuolar-type H+-ATPase catalytic subunit A/Vma1